MHLFLTWKGWHKVGALVVVFLMPAPGTFAQTSSPKTANSGDPEPIPVVQSQKSGVQKTGPQSSRTKSSRIVTGESLSGPIPGAPTSFTNATAITITDCPN